MDSGKKGVAVDGGAGRLAHGITAGEGGSGNGLVARRDKPKKSKARDADPMAAFVEVCLRCKHVYHRGHAEAWFGKHVECAAVECRCRCDQVDAQAGIVDVVASA